MIEPIPLACERAVNAGAKGSGGNGGPGKSDGVLYQHPRHVQEERTVTAGRQVIVMAVCGGGVPMRVRIGMSCCGGVVVMCGLMMRGMRRRLGLEQALGLAQQWPADGQRQGQQAETGHQGVPACHESVHDRAHGAW